MADSLDIDHVGCAVIKTAITAPINSRREPITIRDFNDTNGDITGYRLL